MAYIVCYAMICDVMPQISADKMGHMTAVFTMLNDVNFFRRHV